MLLRIIAIGTKMPSWVSEGYLDYARRFPPGWNLELCEVPAIKRGKNAVIQEIITEESERILRIIKPTHRIIALDVKGSSWSTEQLANNMQSWSQEKRNIDLIIGGPDGLSESCLKKAETRWSLSALTLPHPLVRIVLVEQLYRALCILQRHPYHRGS